MFHSGAPAFRFRSDELARLGLKVRRLSRGIDVCRRARGGAMAPAFHVVVDLLPILGARCMSQVSAWPSRLERFRLRLPRDRKGARTSTSKSRAPSCGVGPYGVPAHPLRQRSGPSESRGRVGVLEVEPPRQLQRVGACTHFRMSSPYRRARSPAGPTLAVVDCWHRRMFVTSALASAVWVLPRP